MWKHVSSLRPMFSSSKSSVLNKAALGLKISEAFTTEILTPEKGGISPKEKISFITFVLEGSGSEKIITPAAYCLHVYRDTFPISGPGSGKGTQCEKICENFGFTHLSAGDLLRKEISSNSKYGSMILSTIREGNIVPSELTIKLIKRELESSESNKFLIDGFPRSEENRIAFEQIIGAEPNIVLFFDCPEEEMVKRVLSRNQGRVDDNIDTIKKRLRVFEASNRPVINYYNEKGKLHKINAVGTVDEIFEQVRPVFAACDRTQ